MLKQIGLFGGLQASKDVSIRKTCGEHRGNKYVPHIDMNLSWACTHTPLPPPHSLSHYIFSVSLSHIEAPLCSFARSPFRMQCRGPDEGLPLALKLNREDCVIWILPGGCQLVLGRADRVAGWRMHADARLPAPSTHGHLLCVEKLCILSLHLNPPSLRPWPCLAAKTSSSARLASINCPCLAHCLLLITLINFNTLGSHHHRGCL